MDYRINNKITGIRTRKETLIKYIVAGMLFGLLFPIGAILFELHTMRLDAAIVSLSVIYYNNPLLYIISSAPFFLGSFSFIAGIKQANVEYEKQQLELKEKEISEIAYHDALTGLPNRVLLDERLNLTLALAHRQKTTMAVLFIDLDDFKTINDTFGHDIGDEVLKETGKRIKECLRQEDTISRFGGDEFIAIVYNIQETSELIRSVERIMKCIASVINIDNQDVRLNSCVGIALYPRDGEDKNSLIKNADSAMYRAKENGKNRFEVYSQA